MNNKNAKVMKKISKFIFITLAVILAFNVIDFTLSEITDNNAYTDAVRDDVMWNEVVEKIEDGTELSSKDYETVFLQSGLGRPAVDRILSEGRMDKLNYYREYYVLDKEYYCYRKGVFACHESITNMTGEKINNPEFADLQNGDIIITLSIHSLGWRHGHAAIVTDAENGIGLQAVMIGEKSDESLVLSWMKYPLVAVLRPKNVDEKIRNNAAVFAHDNLKGLNYSLWGGIFSGRNADKVPSATQCAHLVWYAYAACGVDIAPESGRIITPKDFLESQNLEIVQVYGSILDV